MESLNDLTTYTSVLASNMWDHDQWCYLYICVKRFRCDQQELICHVELRSLILDRPAKGNPCQTKEITHGTELAQSWHSRRIALLYIFGTSSSHNKALSCILCEISYIVLKLILSSMPRLEHLSITLSGIVMKGLGGGGLGVGILIYGWRNDEQN